MRAIVRSAVLQFWMLSWAMLLAYQGQSQMYQNPQPLMYDRGFDQNNPPPGTKHIVMSRYIPGARFPKDYDVVVEAYDYDRSGNLTTVKRFQNITGELELEMNYSWTPDGNVLQERMFVANDGGEIIRNYVWEKDANGKCIKAVVNDKSGKSVANVENLPDGTMLVTENLPGGKYIRSTIGKDRRLMKSENSATGQTEAYTYYPDGTVREMVITSSKGIATVKYENTTDEKGRVIKQTEQGKTSPRTYYFSYDDQGNMVDRGSVPNRPREARGYDARQRLTDVLTYEASGFPEEVLNISYEFW
ncbi:MAG: hypothetical protein RLZZ165_507 [Bacteroidota bacterium]